MRRIAIKLWEESYEHLSTTVNGAILESGATETGFHGSILIFIFHYHRTLEMVFQFALFKDDFVLVLTFKFCL